MTPAAIAADLHAAVDAGLEMFRGIEEPQTTTRPAPGAWCAREILGHLVDSACNNHRRFVLGQDGADLEFDRYDQDTWVARQRYSEVPFRDIAALWTAYNRHLAHVIASAPENVLAHSGRFRGTETTVTLGFLMEDYVTHLRHHLDQLHSRIGA